MASTETITLPDGLQGNDMLQFPPNLNVHTHRILSLQSAGGQLSERSETWLSYSLDAGVTWTRWGYWRASSYARLIITSPDPVVVDYSGKQEDILVRCDLIEFWDETSNPGGKLTNPNPSNFNFYGPTLTCEIGGEINAGICKIEPLIGF